MTELGWKLKSTFETGIGPTIQWNLDSQECINHMLSGEYMRFMEKITIKDSKGCGLCQKKYLSLQDMQ